MAQYGPKLKTNERNTIWLQFKKGDNAPCYSARVKHNGTVSTDDYSGGDTNETMQSNK